MNFTEDERARHDAEEALFKEAHGDCHASRHSASGSLTMHGGRCCPLPPLSSAQHEEIGRILGVPKQPHELMRWRLRLYCGHVVEKRSHFRHTTLTSRSWAPCRAISAALIRRPSSTARRSASSRKHLVRRGECAQHQRADLPACGSRRGPGWRPRFVSWRRRSNSFAAHSRGGHTRGPGSVHVKN
jgi:hypothetical protein